MVYTIVLVRFYVISPTTMKIFGLLLCGNKPPTLLLHCNIPLLRQYIYGLFC